MRPAAASDRRAPAHPAGLNHDAGVVLVADLGATRRLAVSDLAANPLAELAEDIDIALGPERVLDWVRDRFLKLLEQADRKESDVRGIGVGVLGPVAFHTGQPVSPPIMPGWDGFSIPGWFAEHYDVPVLVDNDVNIMAVGEHWTYWRTVEHLLFIKVGTGIGLGSSPADTYTGVLREPPATSATSGSATRTRSSRRCGNLGCLEAVAGGRALAERLTDAGVEAKTSRDVVELVRAGNLLATRLVREAAATSARSWPRPSTSSTPA